MLHEDDCSKAQGNGRLRKGNSMEYYNAYRGVIHPSIKTSLDWKDFNVDEYRLLVFGRPRDGDLPDLEPMQSVLTFDISPINAYAAMAHAIAVYNGWWSKHGEVNLAERLMLCVSELSEAMECLRGREELVWYQTNGSDKEQTNLDMWDGSKLEGLVTELADCVIRILDLCGWLDVDFEKVLTAKMAYNMKRGWRHGGKAF